jgi:hypothetical protein
MESVSGATFKELGAVRSFENTKNHPDLPITNSDTTLSVSDINGITNYKTPPRLNLRHA